MATYIRFKAWIVQNNKSRRWRHIYINNLWKLLSCSNFNENMLVLFYGIRTQFLCWYRNERERFSLLICSKNSRLLVLCKFVHDYFRKKDIKRSPLRSNKTLICSCKKFALKIEVELCKKHIREQHDRKLRIPKNVCAWRPILDLDQYIWEQAAHIYWSSASQLHWHYDNCWR